MTVAIIDYGQGNLRSIAAACEAVGVDARIANRDQWITADAMILPGVGNFRAAMLMIEHFSLDIDIFRHVKAGKPLLGICLGAQLLMAGSEEGAKEERPKAVGIRGLGIIPGFVRKLPDSSEPIPNVGWRKVASKDPLLPPEESFYFCHSYACEPENPEDSIAVTEYGGKTICAAIRRGNVMGVQFHPEKSGPAGLEVLRQFKGMVERRSAAA
jgi:glutamine amidotransferase